MSFDPTAYLAETATLDTPAAPPSALPPAAFDPSAYLADVGQLNLTDTRAGGPAYQGGPDGSQFSNISSEVADTFANTKQVAPMAIRIGAPMAGVAVGSALTAATGGLTLPIGMAIAGGSAALAEPFAQMAEKALGQRQDYSVAEGAINIAVAAIPGVPFKNLPLPSITTRAGQILARGAQGAATAAGQDVATRYVRGENDVLATAGNSALIGAGFGALIGTAFDEVARKVNLDKMFTTARNAGFTGETVDDLRRWWQAPDLNQYSLPQAQPTPAPTRPPVLDLEVMPPAGRADPIIPAAARPLALPPAAVPRDVLRLMPGSGPLALTAGAAPAPVAPAPLPVAVDSVQAAPSGLNLPTQPSPAPSATVQNPPALPEAAAPAAPAAGTPLRVKRISPKEAEQLTTLEWIPKSQPGVSVEAGPNPPAFGGGWVKDPTDLERRVVYRDANGSPKGYLRFYLKEPGSKAVDAPEGISVYVAPDVRRQGIARELYTAASQAGYDVMAVSGSGAMSQSGMALSAALKAGQPPAPLTATMPTTPVSRLAEEGGVPAAESPISGADQPIGRGSQVNVEFTDGRSVAGIYEQGGGMAWVTPNTGGEPIIVTESYWPVNGVSRLTAISAPAPVSPSLETQTYTPTTRDDYEATLWALANQANNIRPDLNRADYLSESRRKRAIEAEFNRIADQIELSRTKRRYIYAQAHRKVNDQPLQHPTEFLDYEGPMEAQAFEAPKANDFSPDQSVRRSRSEKPSYAYQTKAQVQESLTSARIALKGRLSEQRRGQLERILAERTKQLADGKYREAVAAKEQPQAAAPPPSAAPAADPTAPEQRSPSTRGYIEPDPVNHGLYKTKTEATARLSALVNTIEQSPQMQAILQQYGLTPANAYAVGKTKTGQWSIAKTHQHEIAVALLQQKPVSATAVNKYGIKIPAGYVKQGELYVLETTPTATPQTVTPTPSAAAAADTTAARPHAKLTATALKAKIQSLEAGLAKPSQTATRRATLTTDLATYQAEAAYRAAAKAAKGKSKGRGFAIPSLPDGSPDLINTLDELGGIRPRPRDYRGGEYDDLDLTKGVLRQLRRQTGRPVDKVLAELNEGYGYRFESPADLQAALDKALITRARLQQVAGRDQATALFQAAALENKGRGSTASTAKVIAPEQITEGDTFAIKREPVTVAAIDPDTAAITLKDGERFGTQIVPAGVPIYADKGSYQPAPAGEAGLSWGEVVKTNDARIQAEAEAGAQDWEAVVAANQAEAEAAVQDLPAPTRPSALMPRPKAQTLDMFDGGLTDMPFTMAGESVQDFTGNMDEVARQAAAKAEADAAQGGLFDAPAPAPKPAPVFYSGDEVTWTDGTGRTAISTITKIRQPVGAQTETTADVEWFGAKQVPLSQLTLKKGGRARESAAKAPPTPAAAPDKTAPLILWGKRDGGPWQKLTDNTSVAEMRRRQADGWHVGRFRKGDNPNSTSGKLGAASGYADWEAVRRIIDPQSVLPQRVRDAVRFGTQAITGHLVRAKDNQADLLRAMNRLRATLPGLATTVRAYLDGNIPLAALPVSVRVPAQAIRSHIDALSERAVREGVVTGTLARTLLDNQGKYLRRSYRIFDDTPGWIATRDFQVARRNWIAYLLTQPNPAAAGAFYTRDAAEILTNQLTDRENATSFMIGGKVAGRDVSSLIRRKDLPPELRALYGEILDPIEAYGQTIPRLARLVENHYAQQWIRLIGLSTGIFSTSATQLNHRPLVSPNNQPHEVWQGLYTQPVIARALEREATTSGRAFSAAESIFKLIRTFTGLSKLTKTVLNPDSYSPNFIGGIITTLANGNFNLMPLGRGFMLASEELGILRAAGILPQNRAQLKDDLEKLAKLGLRMEGLDSADLIRTWETSLLPMLNNRANRIITPVLGAYGQIDNITKYVSWKNEVARLKKWMPPGTPLETLERIAAERVRATTQVYGSIPKIITDLSRLGIAPSFVSFTWELFRNTANTARIAAQDFSEGARTGNRAQQWDGARRLASLLAVVGGGLGMLALSRREHDITDQQDDTVRFFGPKYDENSTLHYNSPLKDGRVNVSNASYLLPHMLLTEAVMAGYRGDTGEEQTQRFLNQLTKQFLAADGGVFIGPLAETFVGYNRDTGLPVFNRQSPTPGLDAMGYLGDRTLTPLILRKVENYVKAARGEIGPNGKVFSAADENWRLVGARQQTRDLGILAGYKARDLSRQWVDASRLYTALQGRNVPAADLEAGYQRAATARQAVAAQVKEYFRLGLTPGTGLTEDDLIKNLRSGQGLSAEELLGVIDGKYVDQPRDRQQSAVQVLDRAKRLPEEKRMAAVAAEIVRDPKLVKGIMREVETLSKGITQQDRLVLALDVADGSRARYLANQITTGRVAPEQLPAYLEGAKRKGILTDAVYQQLKTGSWRDLDQ